jgi:hypothetical protein
MTETTATANKPPLTQEVASKGATSDLAVDKALSFAKKEKSGQSNGGIHLGVEGLDAGQTQMIPGGLYALQIQSPSTRFPLVASTLKAALSAGVHCTLVTNSAPQEVLARLAQCRGFAAHDLVKQKRLKVFSMQDEFSKKIFRFGADRLVQEIESFEIPINSFIVFEQADEILSLHDLWLASQQIKVLSEWFKRRQTTALMAFTRSNAQQTAALNALMDNLSGLARLDADKAGLGLTFLYWQSLASTIAARNFQLRNDSNGGYEVEKMSSAMAASDRLHYSGRSTETALSRSGESDGQTTASISNDALPLHAKNGVISSVIAQQIASQITAQLTNVRSKPSEMHLPSDNAIDLIDNNQHEAKKASRASAYLYIHNDRAFDRLSELMPGKFSFANSVSEILHFSLERPKAMILLSVDANESSHREMPTVAATIHSIRKNIGVTAKIVVHEKAGALNNAQKKLLMRCGVNELIPEHEALSNFPVRLTHLHEQATNVLVEANFATIFADMESELVEASSAGTTKPALDLNSLSADAIEPQGSTLQAQRVVEKAKRSAWHRPQQVSR